MKTIQYSKLFLGLVFLASMASCVRFERDPSTDNTGGISNLPKNAKVVSVEELRGTFPGNFELVPQFVEAFENDTNYYDYYLLLEVLGNDISGNIYKSMYVRDASNPDAAPEDTRALNLAIDKTNLYNFFPIGQKFYLKCTGLYIGQYNGLPQMGFRYKDDNGSVGLGRIPDEVFMQNVIRYCAAPVDPAHMPKPIEITNASQLDNPALYNQLVLLRNVEFLPGDIGQEFAPAPPTGSNPTTSDRIFTINGTGSNLTLRTSSACRFFRRPVPAGVGDMLCIYAIYATTSKTTQQFYLRQLEDLNLAQFDSTSPFNKLIFWQGFDNGFGDFTVYDVKGVASWEIGLKGDKNYVQLSAYQSGRNEDWLYSPKIELPQAGEYDSILLSFEQAIAYQANPPAENYTIRISEDFSGVGDPREATWKALTIPNPHPGASGNSFVFMNTGNINLNDYAGKKVRVAFVYKNSDDKEPTWEIRKLKIVANK